jgi:hypothetical protein
VSTDTRAAAAIVGTLGQHCPVALFVSLNSKASRIATVALLKPVPCRTCLRARSTSCRASAAVSFVAVLPPSIRLNFGTLFTDQTPYVFKGFAALFALSLCCHP